MSIAEEDGQRLTGEATALGCRVAAPLFTTATGLIWNETFASFLREAIRPVRHRTERSMASCHTILIADRNSHVRMFLMREMIAAGYRVALAASAESVVKLASVEGSIDLLILDPDLPGLEQTSFLPSLRSQNPRLPIVLHTHRSRDDEALHFDALGGLAIIEKTGDSAEKIKALVAKLLTKTSCPEASMTPFWREGDIT
jgi:CheY-like chemotaxis protein